jgi:hypothetical protein
VFDLIYLLDKIKIHNKVVIMAKSNSRKKRDRLIQNGKLDPAIMRGSWNGIKPITKIKPNKRKDDYCDYDQAYNVTSLAL